MSAVDESVYWFTPIDVSDALDLPLVTIYDLIAKDEIGKKVGRTVMISRPEVERLRTQLTSD